MLHGVDLAPLLRVRVEALLELRTLQVALDPAMLDWDDLRFFSPWRATRARRSRQAFARHAIDGQPTFGLAGQDGRATSHRMADGYMLTLAGVLHSRAR